MKSRFAIPTTLLTLLLMIAGCGKSDVMLSDAATTKSEVLIHVPLGSPIDQAKFYMESNGFTCVPSENVRYAEDGPDPSQPIIHGPANILWCDSGEKSTWIPFVSKRWQVSFENVAGKVYYVGVGVGTTSL